MPVSRSVCARAATSADIEGWLVVPASAGVTLTARRGGPEQPQPVDESPGWDLPTPTHATVTGEMPILTAEELHGPARGAEESPGRSR